ncbi:MAG: DUF4388 domain-containing protein, partial [Candidatus Obscuribacterales bacterium]|nr:DUF4388 domain-containing protein [Candidatus Obscuribacterales bacterium]
MQVSAPSHPKTQARSIGVLVDRTVAGSPVLGNVWLIDSDKVATCAHLVVSYNNYLSALAVRFPHSGKEFGVEQAMFHPGFDKQTVSQMEQVALTEPMPTLPLQKHNAVVLKLKEQLPELTDTMVWKVNKNLSLPVPPRDQGLGGNLGEIDLYVVIQTITNARKEGVLIICDDRNHPIARLFCQNGRVMYAQYRNLQNDMAVYQIVNRDLKGNFFFWTATSPNFEVTTPIAKPADMLLIEAHRRCDELKTMVPIVGRPDVLYVRKQEEPNVDVIPSESKDYARMIWPLLDGGTPLGQLWQLANLDDYAIYSTLQELLATDQIAVHMPSEPLGAPPAGDAIAPLELALEMPLEPWAKISNVYIDVDSSRPMFRQGCLLGQIREQDKWHLLHNVRLVPEATGSPMFKDDKVIGMHCGSLPPNYSNRSGDNNLQAMLWVDSIVECLRASGDKEAVNKMTLVEMPRLTAEEMIKENLEAQKVSITRKPVPGCREVAKLDCPKCGRTSLESARFCKSCGQELITDMGNSKSHSKQPIYLVLSSLILLVVVAGGLFLSSLPRPIVVSTQPVVIRESAPLSMDVFRQSFRGKSVVGFWEKQKPATIFKEKDLIHLAFSAQERCFVYLIYKSASSDSGAPALIYPVSPVSDKELKRGFSFTIPSDVDEPVDDKGHHLLGLEVAGPPGTETFLAICSPRKLKLLGNSSITERVFRKAVTLLDKDGVANGGEFLVSDLGEKVLASSQGSDQKTEKFSLPQGAQDDSIYI